MVFKTKFAKQEKYNGMQATIIKQVQDKNSFSGYSYIIKLENGKVLKNVYDTELFEN